MGTFGSAVAISRHGWTLWPRKVEPVARLSRLEQYENIALATLARVLAHEPVPDAERISALEMLASIRSRGKKRDIAKRRYQKRKAARAAAEAAKNDPEAQFLADSERRIREALGK
jgi:hypothetical protein